jgi:hypothetical protein
MQKRVKLVGDEFEVGCFARSLKALECAD